MAIVGAGTFSRLPSVSKCRSLPTLFKRWGIDAVSVSIVNGKEIENQVLPTRSVNGVKYTFFRHPLLLISNTISLWHREYSILQKYGANKNYDDFHPCFLFAEEIYESILRGAEDER